MRYTNPVYPGYLADLFVWRADAASFAIGTGAEEAKGKPPRAEVFPLLRSRDLGGPSWREQDLFG